MNNDSYTVLVTGVGAVIGYGVLKSLRQSGYTVKLIGMDIYPDAVGQYWCDHFEPAIRTDAPEFISFLLSIIWKHNVDLVIPGIEQDVTKMSIERRFLKDSSARLVLNTPELVAMSNDKWLTHLKLVELGLPIIKSYVEGTFDAIAVEVGLPMLMKPRRSYASKGIHQINTRDDFEYWKNKVGDKFMVQQLIGSDEEEYTAAAFGFGDGTCSEKIIFRRVLSGEGSTAKATVVDDPGISERIDALVRAFQPEGPTNFQFRRHEGELYLLEINPRMSSSTSIRTAFGYNEARMCLEYYLENKRSVVGPIRRGRALRFIEDYIVYDRCDI
jgi:carbamoyl-phosphate synthase large subunit